jgi:type IV pilus assembly protein PilV
MMMAMLILIVGMLGLLQAINLAVETNLRNQLREEAVHVGERVMNEFRGKGFANISTASPETQKLQFKTYSIPSKIRGTTRKYGVARASTVISTATPKTKQLEVVVTWKYKGIEYLNRVELSVADPKENP